MTINNLHIFMQSLHISFNKLWTRVNVNARDNSIAIVWQIIQFNKSWNVFENVQFYKQFHDSLTTRSLTLKWANDNGKISSFDRVKIIKRNDLNEIRRLIYNKKNDNKKNSQIRLSISWKSKRDSKRLFSKFVNRHLIETFINYFINYLKSNQLCSNQLFVWHFHFNNVEIILNNIYYYIKKKLWKLCYN